MSYELEEFKTQNLKQETRGFSRLYNSKLLPKMQIAKVRGTVVSTHKEPSLRGVKLILLQFIDEEGRLLPQYEVAGDRVGAGLDEWVLVCRGSAARQMDGTERQPLDAMVVAIIDSVTVENRQLYSKKDQSR